MAVGGDVVQDPAQVIFIISKNLYSTKPTVFVQYFFFFFYIYFLLVWITTTEPHPHRTGSKRQSAQRSELGRRDWDEGGKGLRGNGLVALPGPPVSKGGSVRDERATGLLSVTAPADE